MVSFILFESINLSNFSSFMDIKFTSLNYTALKKCNSLGLKVVTALLSQSREVLRFQKLLDHKLLIPLPPFP